MKISNSVVANALVSNAGLDDAYQSRWIENLKKNIPEIEKLTKEVRGHIKNAVELAQQAWQERDTGEKIYTRMIELRNGLVERGGCDVNGARSKITSPELKELLSKLDRIDVNNDIMNFPRRLW